MNTYLSSSHYGFLCVFVCRPGNPSPLAVWCPPEGRAESQIDKSGEQINCESKTSTSQYLLRFFLTVLYVVKVFLAHGIKKF